MWNAGEQGSKKAPQHHHSGINCQLSIDQIIEKSLSRSVGLVKGVSK